MLKFTVLTLLSAVLTNFLIDMPGVHQQLRKILPAIDRKGGRLFTAEELATFNGDNATPLYLSILGKVYDVSRGVKFYGKGETYHVFVGRDNSRSFVTGNLGDKDISDNVIPFSQSEYRSLKHWADFYKKEYPKVGKLIGRFYDDYGSQTAYAKEVKLFIKDAELAQAKDDVEKLNFPPCNIEWDPNTGTRVWCSNKSGGIERNWVGVPRQFYEVGGDKRCACIHESNQNLGTIKEYEDCDPTSDSCYIANQ